MQNYAGSRLAPWLGHIMVSRSETARQLLTPGEIMQLPPDDEIVMVAGSPPIRAKKARYYIDPRLTERILPPPDPATIVASARPDGWSALKPLAPDAALVAAAEEAARKKAEDKANAGLRREPDMPQHVEIVHEKKEPAPEHEFKHLLVDDQEDSARQRQMMGRQMRGLARQVSMDPNDGIDM